MDINISLNLLTQNIESNISKRVKNKDSCERKCGKQIESCYEAPILFKDADCSTIKEENCFKSSNLTNSAAVCYPKTSFSKTNNCKTIKKNSTTQFKPFYCKPLKSKPIVDHLQTTYQNSFRDPSKVKQTPIEKNGSTNIKFCKNHCV